MYITSPWLALYLEIWGSYSPLIPPLPFSSSLFDLLLKHTVVPIWRHPRFQCTQMGSGWSPGFAAPKRPFAPSTLDHRALICQREILLAVPMRQVWKNLLKGLNWYKWHKGKHLSLLAAPIMECVRKSSVIQGHSQPCFCPHLVTWLDMPISGLQDTVCFLNSWRFVCFLKGTFASRVRKQQRDLVFINLSINWY